MDGSAAMELALERGCAAAEAACSLADGDAALRMPSSPAGSCLSAASVATAGAPVAAGSTVLLVQAVLIQLLLRRQQLPAAALAPAAFAALL